MHLIRNSELSDAAHRTTTRALAVPRWFASGHVQTLGSALPLWAPPSAFRMRTDEAVVVATRGGSALLGKGAFHEPRRDVRTGRGGVELAAKRPVALLVHGVGGSSESKCVLRAAAALFADGYHVVRLNLRGAGDGLAYAKGLYHAGLSDDVARVVAALERDPRVRDVLVLGFSLGGNVVLKLAGEWGARPPASVRGVVSISAPVDLEACSHALESARTYPYRRYVLAGLVAQAMAFAAKEPERAVFDREAVARAKTVRAYDAAVVVPMHGFADVLDYYARASSGPYLPRIEVPTLVVHAADDPMVPKQTVRDWLAVRSPAVDVAWSERGGHVGFFGGVGETHWVRNWAIEQAIQFCERVDPPSGGGDRE